MKKNSKLIFFALSINSLMSLTFIGCGEADKLAQIKQPIETQSKNLETIEHTKIDSDVKYSQNDKVFIREYTYRASEDDSKNSSREKAITQLKVLLSEEVGTHIESYLNIDKKYINGVSYRSINSEIKSISSSITKLEIINEKWDGKNYWMKASVRINEQKTAQLILEAIKSKASEKDVARLNKILAEQKQELNSKNSEVAKINQKLVTQEIINEARKNEVIQMKEKLVEYQQEEIKQTQEAVQYSSELERKKALIMQLNSKTDSKIDQLKKLG